MLYAIAYYPARHRMACRAAGDEVCHLQGGVPVFECLPHSFVRDGCRDADGDV